MNNKWLNVIFILIYIIFGLINIDNGHDWGDDFALYLNQTKHILSGKLLNLYASNKVSMDCSSGVVGPYLYPLFYSVFIIPVAAISNYHLLSIKIFGWLSFVILGFGPLKRVFSNIFTNSNLNRQQLATYTALSLIFLNPKVLELSNKIGPDLLYSTICFNVFSIFLKRNSNKVSIWKLVILTIFGFGTRSNGIFLVLFIVAMILSDKQRLKNESNGYVLIKNLKVVYL